MSSLQQRLEQLRSAFDLGFQEPIAAPAEAPLLLLAIRVANGGFALQVDELAAVSRVEKIVPLPTHAAPLSGIAGIGGRVVAIYDLAVLLGFSPEANPHQRWVAQCARQPAVGIGFSHIEGNLVLPRSELHPAAPGAPAYAVASIGSGPDARWIVSVAEISKSIGRVDQEG